MIASIKLSEVSGALFDEKKDNLYVFMRSGGFIAIDGSAMRNTMIEYNCKIVKSFLYNYITDPDPDGDPTIEFCNTKDYTPNEASKINKQESTKPKSLFEL
jgi:hypothetical protein